MIHQQNCRSYQDLEKALAQARGGRQQQAPSKKTYEREEAGGDVQRRPTTMKRNESVPLVKAGKEAKDGLDCGQNPQQEIRLVDKTNSNLNMISQRSLERLTEQYQSGSIQSRTRQEYDTNTWYQSSSGAEASLALDFASLASLEVESGAEAQRQRTFVNEPEPQDIVSLTKLTPSQIMEQRMFDHVADDSCCLSCQQPLTHVYPQYRNFSANCRNCGNFILLTNKQTNGTNQIKS